MMLAVEYKGEPYKTNDDSREKDAGRPAVGKHIGWALPISDGGRSGRARPQRAGGKSPTKFRVMNRYRPFVVSNIRDSH
jgi:hypothetical protein